MADLYTKNEIKNIILHSFLNFNIQTFCSPCQGCVGGWSVIHPDVPLDPPLFMGGRAVALSGGHIVYDLGNAIMHT